MAKRRAPRLTLDALARNPKLVRTLTRAESARLAHQLRILFAILIVSEIDAIEMIRQKFGHWDAMMPTPAPPVQPRRRRLRALPGGKAKR